MNKYIMLIGLWFFTLLNVSMSQNELDESIINSIRFELRKFTPYEYQISIYHIDSNASNRANPQSQIDDRYGTLSNCYIFIAEGVTDSNLFIPKGIIGVYKHNPETIFWCSDPLSEKISILSGKVSLVGELNADGKDEIIVSQYLEPHGLVEQLWIFNWDGTNGKLITQLDEEGESIVKCVPYYKLIDLDNDGIQEIQGDWFTKDNYQEMSTVTYSWNGSSYGNWGKASKELLEDKRR